jgi:hypothetical protein
MSTTGSTRPPTVPDDARNLYPEHRPTRRRDYTEAKNGFKTTEFMLTLAFIAGVLIATYADGDSLARQDGWFFAALAIVAYVISRGLAKLGVREPYVEERD